MKKSSQDVTAKLSKRKQIRQHENAKDTAVAQKLKADKEISRANESLRSLRNSR